MTISEKIEAIIEKVYPVKEHYELRSDYEHTERCRGLLRDDLHELLREVAAEQREICAEKVHLPPDVEQGDQVGIQTDVRTAPYPEPLNEDSDE